MFSQGAVIRDSIAGFIDKSLMMAALLVFAMATYVDNKPVDWNYHKAICQSIGVGYPSEPSTFTNSASFVPRPEQQPIPAPSTVQQLLGRAQTYHARQVSCMAAAAQTIPAGSQPARPQLMEGLTTYEYCDI